MRTNRIVLFAWAIIFLLQGSLAAAKIDRYALVNRHNITLTEFNALTPVSVGNGRFTFTADLTGLQTFVPIYDKGIPLSTMAQWGWHTFPNTGNYKLEDTFKDVEVSNNVPYWHFLCRR